MKALILIILVLVTSCGIFRIYKPITLKLKGKEVLSFETKGLYYSYNSRQVFVFFNNGVIRGGEKYPETELKKIEDKVLVNYKTDRFLNMPNNWGGFEIEGSTTIIISRWVNIGSWSGYFPISKDTGEIINNKTLVIKINPYSSSKEIQSYIDTFHFLPMKVKPDSTNKYYRKWYR